MNHGKADVSRVPGSIAQALANGRQLLATHPAAALAQAETLIRAAPGYGAAYRLLAAALHKLKRPAEAVQAELNAVRASLGNPILTEASRLIAQRRLGDAEQRLRAFLKEQPDDAAALMILGDMLGREGFFRAGETCLNDALKVAPAYLDARIALAHILFLQRRIDEAIPHLDYVLTLQPHNVSTLRFKATLLVESGRFAEALAIYGALLEQLPGNIALLISKGDTLRTLGRTDEAHAAYRQAVSADAASGRSWWSLATLRAAPLDLDDVATMQQALAASTDDDNRFHLHFALGIALEAGGDHAASFQHYANANRIRRAMLPYDADEVTTEVERSERIFTAPFFAERSGGGDPSPDPVFVLGMPRSGSTLVEQILGSHKLIEGTAELPTVPILIQTMASDHRLTREDSWRELMPRITSTEFAAWGSEYIRQTQIYRHDGSPYFIDKLPHNWADIPFIHLILPNAKIIDVRRNPLDCCWSNFKLLFAQGHPSSYSLRDMAAYYRDYVRMMRHIDAVLPGRVHRVIYEDLVDDLEGQTRALLDYIGVSFDPACLSFHENRRAVATASSQQVRRPLNRAGIGAWRQYEPWLGELVEALGDLPQTYRQ